MTHRVPAIVIVLPVEGAPSVFRRGNEAEWLRLADWLLSRPALTGLLDRAYEAQPNEEVEEVTAAGERASGISLLVRSYENWPALGLSDLAVVESSWLRERGFVLDGSGVVVSWDRERYAFDPDAEPGDVRYRPGAGSWPSLDEIEDTE